MANILISGGTGLVGSAIAQRLISEGHEVRILSRNPKVSNNVKAFYWNVEKNEIDEAAFDGIEHVVHLAGSGIVDKRWTASRKQDIIDSRVNSIKLITSIIKKKNIQLKSFVGASAVGFYGMVTSEKIFTEKDGGSNDFLSDSCHQWENAYSEIQLLSLKHCVLRIGIVLSLNGGVLKKLLPIFKLGLGSAMGSGKQYVPWIHIEDLVEIFHESLFNKKYNGTYNAVAAEGATNQYFSKQLSIALSKPFILPKVPSFVMKLLLGERADVLLKGSQVSNNRILETGFQFKFPQLLSALKNLVIKSK